MEPSSGGQDRKWRQVNLGSLPTVTDKWIEWLPVNAGNRDGDHSATLTVGDFTVFGEFLWELAGRVPQAWGVAVAE